MAPCIHKRRPAQAEEEEAEPTDLLVKKSIKELNDDEICIDSVIYNIRDFKHPGGSIIKLFGGNDVTAQYKMIHHRHSLKEDHFLGKMNAVGKVTDFDPEYEFGTEFEKEIKREVFKIIKAGKDFGDWGYFIRAFMYISFMLAVELFWLFSGSTPTLAVLLGVASAFIGLNVQHDSNHGAASKKPWVNEMLGWGADLIGGSKYSWIEQHWTHHAYTNHMEKDGDAISAEPLMLFTDYPKGDPRRRWFHSFQVIYFLPLLSFYWLSSVFNPQLIDLQQAGTKETMNWDNRYVKSKVGISLLIHGIYVLWNVVSPFYYHSAGTAIYHIWIFSSVESLMLSGLFSLSHNFEGAERDPTKDHREKGEKIDWFKAQVETSSTYGGTISGWVTGGLNFQVEHHLFPRMSSSHYPKIAPTVRRICKKHGVKYAYYPWIHQNFIATLKYMYKAGIGNWEFEALHGKA
ncbi:hypothetical protein TrVE_jg14213 [Triparma verrucosa]|uniref:Fatty acid desaturase domain-containing protein n=2 Tax=Triparma TaxID=722752 RepID=A0A9W7E6P6_9STRA|nr:hypothetical protein TrST_g4873 [Triparma strigata]GMH85088.1 hypothetical protein TrVE_jg14213 [Triparma verrucosa]